MKLIITFLALISWAHSGLPAADTGTVALDSVDEKSAEDDSPILRLKDKNI